jgi:hypothetical protein
LSADPASSKPRSDAENKRGDESPQGKHESSPAATDHENASSRLSADRARLESALRNRPRGDGKNARKDD